MSPSTLDRRITLQLRTVTKSPATGAEQVAFVDFATVWAEVTEFTNVGASEEYLRDGVEVHGGIARIRIRYLAGVDATMRIDMGGGQLRQITGLAQIGRREGWQLSVKEWSHE